MAILKPLDALLKCPKGKHWVVCGDRDCVEQFVSVAIWAGMVLGALVVWNSSI